jgi:Ran GTPase-activating protein (RanGAP) involved in mRNA processing and transport
LDFNTTAVAAALRHNTYFRSISAVGVRRKDTLFHFSNVLRYNTYISKVIFSDLQEGNVAELGDAMAANSLHAVQLLDLSKTHVYKGVSNLAQALQMYQHSLKMLSLSGCNIESAKMLQVVQALSANYGMSITIETLDLSGNKFDEAASLAFESWLSKVAEYSTIRELRLANTGINMASAATYFHFLARIEVLDLSRNKLEPRAVHLTCSLLEKSSTLRDLNVSACNLSAVQAAALLTATGQNKRLQLTSINISNNEFSDSEIETLAAAITACTNCHTLNLSDNVLKEKSLIGLLQSIVLSACPTLDTIVLNKSYKNTYPGERVASALFSVINSLRSVKAVRIADGFGTVVTPLLKLLRNNTNLLELDISDNRLGDKGASAISDLLRYNRTIALIKCDGNNISPTGWKMILSSFIANTTLAYIDFAWKDYSKWASSLSDDRLLELQSVLLDIQRTVQTNSNAEGHARTQASARGEGVPLPLTVAPLANLPHQLAGSAKQPHFRRLSDENLSSSSSSIIESASSSVAANTTASSAVPSNAAANNASSSATTSSGATPGTPSSVVLPSRAPPIAPSAAAANSSSTLSTGSSAASVFNAAATTTATATTISGSLSSNALAAIANGTHNASNAGTATAVASAPAQGSTALRRSLPSDMSGAKLSNLTRAEAGQPFRLVWNYAENSYIDYTSFESDGESDYTNASDDDDDEEDDDDDDDDDEINNLSDGGGAITLANLHSNIQASRSVSSKNTLVHIHGLNSSNASNNSSGLPDKSPRSLPDKSPRTSNSRPNTTFAMHHTRAAPRRLEVAEVDESTATTTTTTAAAAVATSSSSATTTPTRSAADAYPNATDTAEDEESHVYSSDEDFDI